jgi:hypothetical protein
MQSQQLLTESQVFEDEVLAGTESADYPAEEMSERHDHGKNFSGKDRIKLCAKSFISQVYDLLARHTPPENRAKHKSFGSQLECAGINRREVANARVVQVRRSEPTWPRVMRGQSRGCT